MNSEKEKIDRDTYNGWSNYETWAVALWLDNEQETYSYWREQAATSKDTAPVCSQVKDGIWTPKEAAVYLLADQLKEEVTEQNPLDGTASLYADLLCSALGEVYWEGIAAARLLDVEEEPTPVLVHAYTRQEAIEDGTLVDVTATANEAGIKYPTALTRAVLTHCVEVPKGVDGQDQSGRLWDVLWMFRTSEKGGGSELRYSLLVRNDGRKPRLVELKAVCGPGDDLAPVITIMMPQED